MRSRLGRRSGAAAAILLATLIVVPASPASATPVITIDSPRADPPLQSASVTVRGKVTTDVALHIIKRITLSLNGKQTTVDCTERTCPFEWAQSLPVNGPHKLTVSATDGPPVLALDQDKSVDHHFKVAAPPATPVMDSPKVTAGRAVDLSWSRNTEPDMLYYLVTRTDPGGNKTFPVTVRQPATGTKVTLSDTTTSALGAGAYTYQVVAVREGATGDDKSQAASEASRAVSATVPAPLPVTSTTTATAPGAPAGGPTTTAKPTAPAGVDLSGFLSSRSQPIPLPTITVPEPPDTGFSGSLPFGGRPPGEELEEGEADAVPPRDAPSSSVISLDGGRPLVPVAGGLVLLLLALHMRLLGRRVKAAPDRDLPVDLVHHAPAAVVTAGPVGEAERETAVYDVMAEADEEWAPVPPDAEREPDPPPIVVAPAPAPEPQPEPVAPAPEPVALMAEPEPEPEPEPVVVTPEPGPVAVAPGPVAVAPDPEPVAVAPDPEPVAAEPEPEPEPEPEIVTLWAPPPPAEEPEPDEPDPDEILVVEVVSPPRRRLVRAGGR